MGTTSSAEPFEALSSPVRIEILRILARKPTGVTELAMHLEIHEATVRYHLSSLTSQGILETVRETRKGKRGRPATLYRLAPGVVLNGFPPRQYQVLAETLISALQSTLSEDVIGRTLEDSGRQAGKGLGLGLLESDPHLGENVSAYAAAVAKAMHEGFGVEVESEGNDTHEAIITEFTCPFEELAQKYPEIICDHLDRGFAAGLAAALGESVTSETVLCKGHGDEICKFRLKRPGD